ncbi:protein FAR1-RELATED SEQUENCE 5-like [Panicum virgatum]|uniref:FAR1 domain-containing protein n=1 Tax=Panicum virgatum TaxID=38727 RepID=A0A8T0U0T8_PANVG|nr:protein FAR1-RELATED SEQUENCE 5-like [Panicum virgatum]KAG2617790.1 hypothetical protein PVAP13_3NG258002 [Panicum virgatum]KAG2617791.1 hypothetical protein PVAP13_3NG258002 [Panicum virgatum]
MEEPGQIGMAEASRDGEPGGHEVIVNSTLEEGSCTWKISRRAISGPDARIAPWEESAVSKALRAGEGRSNKSVFEPVVGTSFNSCEEAKDFYNLYSWEIGFGVRYGRSRKNSNKYRTRQDIVCSCQGQSTAGSTRTCRRGCPAMIRLLRTHDHGWYISRVVKEHNHDLSDSYAENKQWNSHNQIDALTKDFIRKLRNNNLSIGRVCSLVGAGGNVDAVPLRKETVRNVCAKLSQENMRNDLGKTIELLQQMKDADPGMSVKFRVDTDGRLQSMLWCTGKNKSDYEQFGDAITFDTTYRTNLYKMPFGLFVGVNNHFQSVIFGGVLLTTAIRIYADVPYK